MAERTITVLVEDTANCRGLLAEPGLAFWIELGGKRVLFDTGQGVALGSNAAQLGIRLEQADAIVLSHGHHDHTGGLGEAVAAAPSVPVYAHPAAYLQKYARNPDGTAREIGMLNRDRDGVHAQGALVWVDGPTEVCEGLMLTGPVPRTTDFEDTGGAFFRDQACTEPDDLVDDQAAFIEGANGTHVILGCAHAGIINALQYVRTLTGSRPIHTVVGGMHLLHASPVRVGRTVDELRRLGVSRLVPCHCTGLAATVRLWSEFPDACASCPVGTVLDLAE
ncbi:MAG: MBL fold metallo-hydrolase [Victivallales bacterium]|nr:MBL fold metallo-hydrolase [Victivallales bacterium]